MKYLLYGPPGSGKSTAGHCLAHDLDFPFFDLDQEIETRTGMTIPEIFRPGEAAFRVIEKQVLADLLHQAGEAVIALGAGALLDGDSRRAAEASGSVVCLSASLEALARRLAADPAGRPLLSGNRLERLASLVDERSEHYASFPLQIDTSERSPEEVAWQAQIRLGRFRVTGMGSPYPVLIGESPMEAIGQNLQAAGLEGPVVLVTDENVAACYAAQALRALYGAGLEAHPIVLPASEAQKRIESITGLWSQFIGAGLDRHGTVLALGGGVVTDLAGFAAATYLRGVRWAAVPTSLLGMVDASLGGKTGIDLEQGKNLAGAFHAPSLVLAFPELLATLPEVEIRNGLAEVVKSAIIGDAELFEICSQGWEALAGRPRNGVEWRELVKRAMAVKIKILLADPYEKSRRMALNLGHTLGHAIEQASGYRLRHGEAVAIGMQLEARLGERMGITNPGLPRRLAQVLSGLGLPAQIPGGLDPAQIQAGLRVDKKRRTNRIRVPLPVAIGEVREGVEIEEEKLWPLFLSCMDPT